MVCPSNCGSASRTVTTAVRPSSTSSLTTSSSLTLQLLGGAEHLVEGPGDGLLEPGHVGAALGGGDHVDERPQLGVVAGAPPHRDVDGEVALDVLRGHVPQVVEQRDGLGEVSVPCEPQHLGDRLVGGQELAELGDAAVVPEARSSTGSAPRRSRIDQLEARAR